MSQRSEVYKLRASGEKVGQTEKPDEQSFRQKEPLVQVSCGREEFSPSFSSFS